MTRLLRAIGCVFCLSCSAHAGPVLLVSLDGLRPGDVYEADKRGLKIPNLRALVAQGAHASGVRVVLPSLTYPSHTSMITGVRPAEHAIASNNVFGPMGERTDTRYWFASDIKAQTLWDGVHQSGGTVASMTWPVSLGSPSIDVNISKFGKAKTTDEIRLLRALDMPANRLERETGVSFPILFGEDPQGDAARTKYAAKLLEIWRPQLFTLHLDSLDYAEHVFGPGSPEAADTLEKLDADLGELIAAAKRAEPDITVAVISDHGFAATAHEVNLTAAFAAAGLVTLDAEKKTVVSWRALPWNASGSSLIMLADPADTALEQQVGALLRNLARNPENGIDVVFDRREIAARGGPADPSFLVGMRRGFYAGNALSGPLVTPSRMKGTHGYPPDRREMLASFFLAGPGIAPQDLGEIDLCDVAPTLANILGVRLPGAKGRALALRR